MTKQEVQTQNDERPATPTEHRCSDHLQETAMGLNVLLYRCEGMTDKRPAYDQDVLDYLDCCQELPMAIVDMADPYIPALLKAHLLKAGAKPDERICVSVQ